MVPHHLAAIKRKTNHHLQVTVLLTFLIMYHSALIVITPSTMYKIFKVQYAPSHSYLCNIAQEGTYMVCHCYSCVAWLCRFLRDSALYRSDVLPTTQPCTAPWMIITAAPASTMLVQRPCHHPTACSCVPTDWNLSCSCSHCIPAELHRHQQPAPSALGQTLGLIIINRLI